MPTARACSFKGIKRIIKSRGELLHSAGEGVQEIVETLADTGEAKYYEKAVKALNDYFTKSLVPQHGITGRRNCGSIRDKIQSVVKDCDYGEQAENQIHDQVVQQCK